MKYRLKVCLVSSGLMIPVTLFAAPHDGRLDPLVLMGRGQSDIWGANELAIQGQRHRVLDGAALISRSPGASVVRNGSQTGIAQIRGLSGDRVRVLIGGMSISPACPNHMDPPLHYAGASSTTRLELVAGVSPVSLGGDSLGGTIRLSQADPVFSSHGTPLTGGEIDTFYRGSHDSYGLRGEYAYANENTAFDYRGSWSTANDLRIPGGTLRASGFDTQRHDITASLRTDQGFLTLDAGLSSTRDAGTPALKMDMIEDDSWHVGLRYKTELGVGTLDTYLYMHDIDHLMTNHDLRPATMRMDAPASSRDYGLRSEYSIPLEKNDASTVRIGIDLHRNEFDADQVNHDTGAVRDTFADNRRERFGVFAEWEKQWSKEWSSLLGLRGDLVKTSAGKVRPGFGMPAVTTDAAAFNAGDRSHDDYLVDLVAALKFEPNEVSSYELAFAMKNRAPSLLERYLWTPLGSSAGLADGRTYLGNTELDPETSFQISASAARKGDHWQVKLTPFYNYIEDYIQGMPMTRSVGGLPVLQFQNIDHVELYGAELAAIYEFTDQLSLSGHASYVRGRDTSHGDNLYRIAPLNGLVDLAWVNQQWEFHCELEWAADQNQTSAFNGESSTAGYALVHLRAAHQMENGPRIEVGIENLLDEQYSDHLGGINRVGGSDVAVGQRIPGAGRFAYVNMSWKF